MDDLHRKIGVVTIPERTYQEEPEKVQLIFSNLVPLRIERRYDLAAYEIMAISEAFGEIEEGSIAPPYEAIFREEDENTFVEFKRI
jgi:hypothetical protein